MIYSDAFDSVPESVRADVYRKIYEALTGKDTRMSDGDKTAVFEILRDTKAGLPAYWSKAK
jgi:hypothetical protein